jgi:hypothetical protein
LLILWRSTVLRTGLRLQTRWRSWVTLEWVNNAERGMLSDYMDSTSRFCMPMQFCVFSGLKSSELFTNLGLSDGLIT